MSIQQHPNTVELTSPLSFDVTVDRLVAAIIGAGMTVFARIDHAENARQAGMKLPPAIVLIYGNAKGGTPIMQQIPQAALDLPLRVLVREDGDGNTLVSFHPVVPMLAQAGVPSALAARLNPAQHVLAAAIQS